MFALVSYLSVDEAVYWRFIARTKSVLKGEYQLIGGLAAEIYDVIAGEVSVCGHRRVLKVHGEDDECFKERISPDWGCSC